MVAIYRMSPTISVNLFTMASVRKLRLTNFQCCFTSLPQMQFRRFFISVSWFPWTWCWQATHLTHIFFLTLNPVRYIMGQVEGGQVPLTYPFFHISVSIHRLQVRASVNADRVSQCAIDIRFVAHSVDKCWIFTSISRRFSFLLACSVVGSVLLLSLKSTWLGLQ